MQNPLCPNCNKSCSPAGGVIGTLIKYWKCFTCGYSVEDIPYAEENPCGFVMHRPILKLIESDGRTVQWQGESIPDTDWEKLLEDTTESWESMGK